MEFTSSMQVQPIFSKADAIMAFAEEMEEYCESSIKASMTMASEDFQSTFKKVAKGAREFSRTLLNKIMEFMRKVRAYCSGVVVYFQKGAIVDMLNAAVSKGKRRLQQQDEDWYDNAPSPEKASAWNTEMRGKLSGLLFATKGAADELINGTRETIQKFNAMVNNNRIPVTTTVDGNFKQHTMPSGGAGIFVSPKLEAIAREAKIAIRGEIAKGKDGVKPTGGGTATGNGPAFKAGLTNWNKHLSDQFIKEFTITSGENNPKIAANAIKCANMIINTMRNDTVIASYKAVKELETEVEFARKLAAMAGYENNKALDNLRNAQKFINLGGTTAVLIMRRQLASYKVLAATCLRMFNVAGYQEQDDYKKED